MKKLLNYIQEAMMDPKKEVFTFNFTDLEDPKETLKSIEEMSAEAGIQYEIEGEIVTFTLNVEDEDKFAPIGELLSDYAKVCNNSGHRASHESYALKLHAFEDALEAVMEFFDSQYGDEDEEDTKDEVDPKENTEEK